MSEQYKVKQAMFMANLIVKSMQENLTSEEKEQLADWLNEDEANMDLYAEMTNETEVESALARLKMIDTTATKPALKRLHKQLFTISINKWWYAAAAALIISGGLVFLKFSHNDSHTNNSLALTTTGNDIGPGSKKAILTLANGSVIGLTNNQNGRIATEDNSIINITGEGELKYEAGKNTATHVAFNTLSTPQGGEYQIILSDGTRIWLNAATTLRYPASFSDKERVVELVEGEAYFEVAKQTNPSTSERIPFRVQVKNTVVEVKGTHFNINAYPETSQIKTTLLEGLVDVKFKNKTVAIQPGEQTATTTNDITVNKDVDLDHIIAWQRGEFDFNQNTLPEIMAQLSRWYDVTVEYKNGEIPSVHFTGGIRRHVEISKVLEMLQLTGAADFKLQDRKVIISSPPLPKN